MNPKCPSGLRRTRALALATALLIAAGSVVVAPAAESLVIPLWPEGVPDAKPDGGAEYVKDDRIHNVQVPTLTYFAPAPGKSAGTAIIYCPGGGYERLAVSADGGGYRSWLNGEGIHLFVLKYRLKEYGHPAPLRDVLRAIRLVRSRAAEWGISPGRIGLLGGSAGGHLAASAATLWDAPEGRTQSPLDEVSGRPDFVGLMFPVITMEPPFTHRVSRLNLIGPSPDDAMVRHLSLHLQVRRDTPPTFIIHTQEDQSVPVENSLLYYRALREAGVPVEMHLYEKGPHGFGLRPGFGPTSQWPRRFDEWLQAHGWLPSSPGTSPAKQ
jgi:acetyl esterase/lipase